MLSVSIKNPSKAFTDKMSDLIREYTNEGYKIDCKESIIDKSKEPDVTFKTVINKDINKIHCKVIIEITEHLSEGWKFISLSKDEYVDDDLISHSLEEYKYHAYGIYGIDPKSLIKEDEINKAENEYLDNLKKRYRVRDIDVNDSLTDLIRFIFGK